MARGLASALARAISCPVDFPAVATLAAASGAIGQSCSLLVKPNYFQSAALYLAFVGGASSGKSPSFRKAIEPLWKISHRLKVEWDGKMEEWEKQDPNDRGRPPRMGRILSTEPTTEALGPILMSNPRGMMVAYDEMTRWVLSMDQYKGGKGGDRQFYLSAWGGEPVCVDRAKNMQEPIMVPHPFVAVAGGMVPAMLPSLAEGKGQEDGFMARLLFAFPDRMPKAYSEHGVPEETITEWRSLIEALHARPMAERDGMPIPRVVQFNDQAKRDWTAWMHAHYAEQNTPNFPIRLEGAWGKLDAYAARLALVLHLMSLAGDPTIGPTDEIPPIDRQGLDDALRLIAYFKGHAYRVYAAIGGTDDLGGEKVNDHVRALIGWIVRNELEEFSERDIDRNFDRFDNDPAALVEALEWLTKRQLVRPKPVAPKKGPGRRPGPAYLVNRIIRDDPRFRKL